MYDTVYNLYLGAIHKIPVRRTKASTAATSVHWNLWCTHTKVWCARKGIDRSFRMGEHEITWRNESSLWMGWRVYRTSDQWSYLLFLRRNCPSSLSESSDGRGRGRGRGLQILLQGNWIEWRCQKYKKCPSGHSFVCLHWVRTYKKTVVSMHACMGKIRGQKRRAGWMT